MNYHSEVKNINELLSHFSNALNTGYTAAIPAFFTENGKFMPQGIQTIHHPYSLAKGAKKQLLFNAFQIQYTLRDIEIEGEFALVTATANTSQLEAHSPLATTKTTRDFFVFKKTVTAWKIHRYIFNNFK